MNNQLTSVMINGLPGNMASAVLALLKSDPRFTIVPYALTGPEITKTPDDLQANNIQLIHYPNTDLRWWADLKSEFANLVAVDFTHPSVANENADLYRLHGVNFVMGTTGGDRNALTASVVTALTSGHCAVIAPNMAKQIVMLQAMLEYAAKNFPKAFAGYRLKVCESHQAGKADTSGTAKAMVGYFNSLGIPFNVNQIVMIRDKTIQRAMGVPEEYLDGHGWHTYTLESADGNVLLQITHNVCGRSIYAAGTRDAILFLQNKVNNGARNQVFSMIDVLNG